MQGSTTTPRHPLVCVRVHVCVRELFLERLCQRRRQVTARVLEHRGRAASIAPLVLMHRMTNGGEMKLLEEEGVEGAKRGDFRATKRAQTSAPP